jgi:uncharacterized membrane protein YbaN (DUF454 family)
MRALVKSLIVQLVGWAFIVLGILGLFLPVLQGILFILIGLIILSTEYQWAHRLLEKVKTRFPSAARRSHEASEKAKAWLRRLRRQPDPPQP